MKLITWNCNGAFTKKAHRLFEHGPDVAVVQECSEASTKTGYLGGYTGLWLGGDAKRGLGVFCREGWTARIKAAPVEQWIAPVTISGTIDFTLVAVWACAVQGHRNESYVGQIHRSLSSAPEWLSEPNTILAGDFNSDAQLDKGRRLETNHSAMVGRLKEHDLVSAYHTYKREDHGKESEPTFHMYRRETSRPFHFDYVFMPQAWTTTSKVHVGSHADWSGISDHYPVTVEID